VQIFTTGNTIVAMRGSRTAKGKKDTAKPLPSVDARQRKHGNVANGNEFFAVRHAIYARQRPLSCVACFAVRLISLPCVLSLPCAWIIAVRDSFVVRLVPLPSV
jgi:hypothetical protein